MRDGVLAIGDAEECITQTCWRFTVVVGAVGGQVYVPLSPTDLLMSLPTNTFSSKNPRFALVSPL